MALCGSGDRRRRHRCRAGISAGEHRSATTARQHTAPVDVAEIHALIPGELARVDRKAAILGYLRARCHPAEATSASTPRASASLISALPAMPSALRTATHWKARALPEHRRTRKGCMRPPSLSARSRAVRSTRRRRSECVEATGCRRSRRRQAGCRGSAQLRSDARRHAWLR